MNIENYELIEQDQNLVKLISKDYNTVIVLGVSEYLEAKGYVWVLQRSKTE